MIRDISEIQTLATKYSKPQLARMAQMGLIDPTKAVMAGMMIDRITKSNMQMPTETVADEALRPVNMPMAGQQNMQQPMQQPAGTPPVAPAGIGGLPPQAPPNAGVAALPSGIKEMADGGIVAFAGVGPSLVEAPALNPDEQLRQIKLREQQEEQVRLEAERKEKSRSSAFFSGYEALNPNQRQGMATTVRQKIQNNLPLTESEKGLLQTVPQFKSMVDAEMAKYPQSSAPVAAALPDAQPGTQTINRRNIGTSAANQRRAPAAAQPTEQTPPPPAVQEQPLGLTSIAPKRPDPYVMDPNVGKFTTTDLPVPKEKTIKDQLAERAEADRIAGVNTDIYKDMMKDLEGKRGKLAGRKQEAVGNALMQTGLALLGSRRGQEFAVLGEAGQRSLQGLALANEKIRETEDRLDDARRSLLMSENDYKRTRSDKALDDVNKQRDKIEGLQIRNIEQKNLANQKMADIGVQLQKNNIDLRGQEFQGYGYELNAQTQRETEASRRAGAMDVAQVQEKARIEGIKLQGQNQLAVQRLQNLGLNRPGETERLMTQHDQILKTQGPEAAERFVQLQERMSGRGKSSNVSLQEQYADDWNKMDPMQRKNYKDQGINNEQQYIDYRLRMAGRSPTIQQSPSNVPPVGTIQEWDGKKWRFKGGENKKENWEQVR